MIRLRRIFETTPEFSFVSPQTEFSLYWNKFLEQKDKYFAYMRKRKKSWKETVKRTRSLLYLLDKLIKLQEKIDDQNRISIIYPEK